MTRTLGDDPMDERLGDDPAVSDAIDAMSGTINRTELMMDAEAFIEEGVAPDDLPNTRDYRYRYPEDGRDYRSDLETVLRRYYDEHGYPEADDGR